MKNLRRAPVFWPRRHLIWFLPAIFLLGCNLAGLPLVRSRVASALTPTLVPVQFSSPTPTALPSSTPTQSPTPTTTFTALPSATFTPQLPTSTPTPLPTFTPAPPPADTASPELAAPTTVPEASPIPIAPPAPGVDFVLRYVRMRTNEENSWDGTLGLGQCGSDHSIYVHVADAQENLLDGILIGDKYGNFEVPTGVDGPGAVRILVWSATMELAVMGHQDGSRYTSQFTPPLSTLDEQIPLEWLQQAGYCVSPEDCRWRVDNNQLCRGHYSYDVIFQRTW